MSIQIQIRGGTTAEHSAFKGVSREITCDTNKKTIVVQDGQTPGGFPLAREDLDNVSRETIAGRGIAKDDLSNADCLVGFIFSAAVENADGFLRCDGAAISRELYARLFAKIGTAYGAGDGETTFNLPNLKVPITKVYDATAEGQKVVILSDGQMTITSTTNHGNGARAFNVPFQSTPAFVSGGVNLYAGERGIIACVVAIDAAAITLALREGACMSWHVLGMASETWRANNLPGYFNAAGKPRGNMFIKY